ncbi:MAG: aldose 1-epimerase family protein [Salinivirgaceae bacterium]
MIHTISNTALKLSVDQTGAEICSIKSIKSDKEYIWNANPEYWASHAPILFPIIGSLKGNQYTYDGNAYSMPKHGFIRYNQNIELIFKETDRLVFKLVASPETLSMYPFLFEFVITFQLIGNRINILHKITNLDTKEMYFALGGHPAFNCPINKGESFSDYYLEFESFEKASSNRLAEGGLVTDKTYLVLDNTDVLPLKYELFEKDALIFKKLKSRKVRLRSHISDQYITVRFSDFIFLGVWTKPNAPFICIEPWQGISDSVNSDGHFKNKEGIIKLQPGKQHAAQYSIEINE